MVLGGNNQEILNEIIKQQKIDNKRIERLETLEFHKARLGIGCIEFLDWDHVVNAAVARVDVPVVASDYGWTQLTIFWDLFSSSAVNVEPLYLRVDALAANYSYTYKYGRGAAMTVASADGAAQWIVGRIGGTAQSTALRAVGECVFPFWAHSAKRRGFGRWEAHDDSQVAGSKQEAGEWGGINTGANGRPFRFDFTAATGNLYGFVYIYGWCPVFVEGQGPPD